MGADWLPEAHRHHLRALESTSLTSVNTNPPGSDLVPADHLTRLAPDIDRSKIVYIPWGIPDHLVAMSPPRSDRSEAGPLKLLYAGRLTSEKGVLALAEAVAGVPDVELSIAAPKVQYVTLAPQFEWVGCRPRYLGWLDRPKLWAAFADHDALVVPSTTLELSA